MERRTRGRLMAALVPLKREMGCMLKVASGEAIVAVVVRLIHRKKEKLKLKLYRSLNELLISRPELPPSCQNPR